MIIVLAIATYLLINAVLCVCAKKNADNVSCLESGRLVTDINSPNECMLQPLLFVEKVFLYLLRRIEKKPVRLINFRVAEGYRTQIVINVFNIGMHVGK